MKPWPKGPGLRHSSTRGAPVGTPGTESRRFGRNSVLRALRAARALKTDFRDGATPAPGTSGVATLPRLRPAPCGRACGCHEFATKRSLELRSERISVNPGITNHFHSRTTIIRRRVDAANTGSVAFFFDRAFSPRNRIASWTGLARRIPLARGGGRRIPA